MDLGLRLAFELRSARLLARVKRERRIAGPIDRSGVSLGSRLSRLVCLSVEPADSPRYDGPIWLSRRSVLCTCFYMLTDIRATRHIADLPTDP